MRHRLPARLLLAALLAIVAGGCEMVCPLHDPLVRMPAGRTEVTVSCEQGRNVLFAPTRINGRPTGGRFMIDTGAEANVAHSAVAHRVGLRGGRAGYVSGAGGRGVSRAPCASNLTVGDVTLGAHHVIVTDLGSMRSVCGDQFSGVLGYPLLSRMPFTVDYAASTVTFHARAAFRPPEDAVRVPLRLINRRPYVTCRVNGARPGWFLLDTGTTGGLTMRPDGLRDPKTRLVARTSGIRAGPAGVSRDGVAKAESVELFGQRFRDVLVTLDANRPRRAGTAGLIGAGLLKHFRLSFDYQRSRLWVQHHPPETAAQMVARGADLEERDLVGFTALARAALDNEADRVRELLAHGADPNAATSRGMTPLHAALGAGAKEAAEVLLEAGVDVNATASDGITPLMIAAGAGCEDLVLELLRRGARPTAKDNNGKTAVDYARNAGHADIVKLLGKRP